MSVSFKNIYDVGDCESLLKSKMEKPTRYGFTAGCFDWFHDGHERLLQVVKSCCEHMIVIIHDDVAIRTLKNTEIVQPLRERINIISKFTPYIIVVKGQDCREAVQRYLDVNSYIDKSNSFFVRGDDNEHFPNRTFFEMFTNVILIPYYRKCSSTTIRKYNNPVQIHSDLNSLSENCCLFYLKRSYANSIKNGNLISFPLQIEYVCYDICNHDSVCNINCSEYIEAKKINMVELPEFELGYLIVYGYLFKFPLNV